MCGAVRTSHGSSFLRIRQCALGTQTVAEMHRDILVEHAIQEGGGEGGGGRKEGREEAKYIPNQRSRNGLASGQALELTPRCTRPPSIAEQEGGCSVPLGSTLVSLLRSETTAASKLYTPNNRKTRRGKNDF